MNMDNIKLSQIKELLLENFQSVYCDTCRYDGEDTPCDECDRRKMYWSLSDEKAEQLANEIIKIYSELKE